MANENDTKGQFTERQLKIRSLVSKTILDIYDDIPADTTRKQLDKVKQEIQAVFPNGIVSPSEWEDFAMMLSMQIAAVMEVITLRTQLHLLDQLVGSAKNGFVDGGDEVVPKMKTTMPWDVKKKDTVH